MNTELDLIRKNTNHGGQPLGDLLWWELVDAPINCAQLEQLWRHSALPTELLPEPPTPERTFKTAMRETQVGQPNRLIRLAKEDEKEIVVGIVGERRDGAGGLTYHQEARITLDRQTNALTSDLPEHDMVQKLLNRHSELRDVHTTDDIRRTITRTLDSFAAVTLRQMGGVYWVPSPYAQSLRRLADVIQHLGTSKMHLVPITKSKEGQSALAQAAKASIEEELNTLREEIRQFLAEPPERASTLVRRLTSFEDLRRKAGLYQAVLQAQVSGLSEALTEMEGQVHGLLANKKSKAA